jgi:hypothetical protein
LLGGRYLHVAWLAVELEVGRQIDVHFGLFFLVVFLLSHLNEEEVKVTLQSVAQILKRNSELLLCTALLHTERYHGIGTVSKLELFKAL